MWYRVHLVWAGFELTTLVLIYTDCIGSYKSNYHTITTMAVSFVLRVVMTFRIYKKNMRNLILNELVFLKKTDLRNVALKILITIKK
jgi:hypothetical protein